MKKLTIAAALLIVGMPAFAADAIPASLEKSLRAFDLQAISYQDKVLRVMLNRPVVHRDSEYKTIVSLGLCAPYWRKSADLAKFNPKRFEVMNARQAQGYALDGDIRKNCDAVGGQNGTKLLQDASWVCVAGMPCRPRRAGERTGGDD